MYLVDCSLDIDGRDINGDFPDSGDDRNCRYSSVINDGPVSSHSSYTYRAPKYSFNSYAELASSQVFQTALSMALAHKDRQIRELQEELVKANDWMSP